MLKVSPWTSHPKSTSYNQPTKKQMRLIAISLSELDKKLSARAYQQGNKMSNIDLLEPLRASWARWVASLSPCWICTALKLFGSIDTAGPLKVSCSLFSQKNLTCVSQAHSKILRTNFEISIYKKTEIYIYLKVSYIS